jgi:hypothetical protein
MVYLLHGDITQARVKLQSLLAKKFAQKPNASLIKVDEENWGTTSLDELIGGQGLFENAYIVAMDNLLGNKEIKEVIVKRLKDMKASSNIFIFIADRINAPEKKAFEKNAEKIQEFEKHEGKKDRYNAFVLSDALASRDKKKLWVNLLDAFREDIVPEEIHGMLFWQVKSMIIASEAKNATEAGLNPFVFSKAKAGAGNFSKEELERISAKLVHMYHDAHRGIIDFDIALEKFALEI